MALNIELRRLGNSDLLLSPIGLGCWQFSLGLGFGGKYWPILEESEIKDIIQITLNRGINWFDTAEAYGWGASENITTQILRKLGKSPAEIFIATKWWPFGRTANSITATIDHRLKVLNGFKIDLYQVHQPFSFSRVEAEMRAMAKLVKNDKIRYVGVSNFSAQKMIRADHELQKHGLKLVSNQVKYSLLNRQIERNGILLAAKELGVAIIAYSPLAQGLLSGKFHADPSLILHRAGYRKYLPEFKRNGLDKSRPVIEVLRKFATKYEVSPAQIALNWVFNYHSDLVFAIPGATTAKQAGDNIGALRFRLTADEMEELNKVSEPFK